MCLDYQDKVRQDLPLQNDVLAGRCIDPDSPMLRTMLRLARTDSSPFTATVTAARGTAGVDMALSGFPVHCIRAPSCMSAAAAEAHFAR